MVDMTTMNTMYDIPNIGCLLGTAYQAESTRLSNALAEAGLEITVAEYLILRILLDHQTIQQCDIARILGKDKAAVSRSIQSLVKKGLVDASQVSYKCCMLSLSEKGEALGPLIIEIADARNKALAEKLSKQQMETLREILITIIK